MDHWPLSHPCKSKAMFLGTGGGSTVSQVCVGLFVSLFASTPPEMGCHLPASLPWALLGYHEQLQRQRGHLHFLWPPRWWWRRRTDPACSVSPHPKWAPAFWPTGPSDGTTHVRAQNGCQNTDCRVAPAPLALQGVAAWKWANGQRKQPPRGWQLHIRSVIWHWIGTRRNGKAASTTVKRRGVQSRRVWRWKKFTIKSESAPSTEAAFQQWTDT